MPRSVNEVLIIGDSRGQACEADCGVDWSTAETMALARQRVKERFGDRVRLVYLALARAGSNAGLQAKIKGLPAPVLVVNGQPRISGRFDTRMLLDAIDAALEMES